MGNMHKSNDGKWRACEAKIKCGLVSGHVSSENMQNASVMMNTMGFDSSKSLSKMSSKDIEQLGKVYNNKRNNTPAFLLSDNSNGYVPPMGLVLPLSNVVRGNKSDSAQFFNDIVQDYDIKGTVETEKVVQENVNAGSAALEKIAITKVSLDIVDPNTDEKKTVSFAKKMKMDGTPPSVPALLNRMFRDAKYLEDTGLTEVTHASIKEYAAKNRKPFTVLRANLPKGVEARKALIEIFGEETYKSVTAQTAYHVS